MPNNDDNDTAANSVSQCRRYYFYLLTNAAMARFSEISIRSEASLQCYHPSKLPLTEPVNVSIITSTQLAATTGLKSLLGELA